MTQTIQNLRLRARSGEFTGKWLWTIGLVAKSGAQFRGPLPFEDVDLHPERYLVHPQFIDDEESAWKSVTLEDAQRSQRILKREGIDTELA